MSECATLAPCVLPSTNCSDRRTVTWRRWGMSAASHRCTLSPVNDVTPISHFYHRRTVNDGLLAAVCKVPRVGLPALPQITHGCQRMLDDGHEEGSRRREVVLQEACNDAMAGRLFQEIRFAHIELSVPAAEQPITVVQRGLGRGLVQMHVGSISPRVRHATVGRVHRLVVLACDM